MAVRWLNSANRDKLESQFEYDVNKLLHNSWYFWNVVYGYRSLELQKQLYVKYVNGGPLAAPPGKSAHNYGLAVDVQLVRFEYDLTNNKIIQKLDWNTKNDAWQWLFKEIAKHPRLRSGIHFNDAPHIERYKWREHVTDYNPSPIV